MVGFERLHAHGPLPASAHLEWPFLSDAHRHLAQAFHAWLAAPGDDSRADWAAALRAAGWPGLATDQRGRAVLAEALAAHHRTAWPAAQALWRPAALLGLARRLAREWHQAAAPAPDGVGAAVKAQAGRLEASLEAAALGVYRAAWQADRHANDAAIDEAAVDLATLMLDALFTELQDALGALPAPATADWGPQWLEARQRAQEAAQRVGQWRLQHP